VRGSCYGLPRRHSSPFNIVWAAWAHGYYEVMSDYCEPDRRFRNKPGISCARGWYTFAVGSVWVIGVGLLTPLLLVAVSCFRRARRNALRLEGCDGEAS
jgi:hypothetical protein